MVGDIRGAAGHMLNQVSRTLRWVSTAGALLALGVTGAAQAAAPLHPSPIPSRTSIQLGSALWYACADPAFGGPAALNCQVKPSAPATAASLAASYTTTFTNNFDRLSPENEFKMLWTEPTQGTFDFKVADKIAAFAKARGKHVRGHTLIYAAANPGWINKPFLIPWNRNTLLSAMKNHITKEVTHFATTFPGVVDEWDVVNEPLVDSGARDQNVYQKTIGNDWIDQALIAANAADPNALLYINEFNADTPGPRQQGLLALVKDLVTRHIPIDGVGLEMHIGAAGTYPTLSQLETVMGQYAALGLRVTITEADVLRPVPDDDGSVQRAAYDTVAQACREMANCTGLTVWGVADQYSWRGAVQHADLFDTLFNAKPSYGDVRCRLNDPKPATGLWIPVACAPPAPASTVSPNTFAIPPGPDTGTSVASNPQPATP